MSDPLRNEACLRAIVSAARVGLWEWDIATSCVTFSAEWKRQLGYGENEIGTGLAEWEGRVHPEDFPEMKRLLAEYFAHPESQYEAEYRMRHKDGSWRWVLARADLVRDKAGNPRCFVGSHFDITEFKRAARDHATAARTSAELSLRQVFRHAHTLVMKADVVMPEGWEQRDASWVIKHFRWNAWFVDEVAALEVMPVELAPGESYRDGWNRAKHRADLMAMDMTAANAFIARKTGWVQEFRAIDREGRLHWFSQVAAIKVTGRGRWHVTAINTDITERKRAECELERMNRALRMLTDANQVLVRGTDEPSLLREVCRIAVEVGGYRMAWVGFAENDGPQTVRPAAQTGFEAGALESFAITWADRAGGRGPVGTAIRTGQPCIARDIPGDPAYAFWSEAVVCTGCASSISLPLINESWTFGVLNIHSGDAHAFDAEEAQGLVELAGDLSCGINTLRARAERDRAMAERTSAEQALQRVLRHARALGMEAEVTAPEGWETRDASWLAGHFQWTPRFVDEDTAREVMPVELAPGEAYHHGWTRAKHGGDVAMMALTAAQAFVSGAPGWEKEFRAIDREGRLHWFAQVAAIKATGCGRWYVTTVNTDITERKEAELRVRQLNRTYSVISDINQLIVRRHEPQAILDGACRIAVENGGFLLAWIGLAEGSPDGLKLSAHAGATADTVEIINRSLGDPDLKCPFLLQALATGGHAVCNDLEHDPQAAVWREESLARGYRAMISLPLTVAGKRAGVFNLYAGEADFFDADELLLLDELAQDIAFALEGCALERERQEAVVRIRQLAAFPELNPNPVLEFAGDGALSYCNQAAQTLSASLGLPEIGALLPPDTRAIVRACLDTDQPRLRLETVHGPRTLSWSFYPIGEVNAVHCYVGEITARLRLEEQFRQSQKMEAVGQLAGGVAHDFNNLLTVIQMQASFLLSEPHEHSESVEGLRQIMEASSRASNLTRQLLTFSRRHAMEARDLDLSDVVGTMTQLARRLLGADITLETRFSPLLPMVHADPGMMEQVLMNLLVNARDAMRGGGKLMIELEAVDLDAAAVAAQPSAAPGRFVRLTVRDSGVGIAPENLPHIFEPFFTTKEVGKGTGLGLATTFGIVQQHNGWIEVTSEPGRGTSMRVVLPAINLPAGRQADPAKPPTPRGGTETVLLVEDEAAVREIAALMLRSGGYRVLEAPTAAGALSRWDEQQGKIDLLVTDLVMPGGMSGQKLAAELRTRCPALRVVFTSGYSKEAVGDEVQFVSGVNFLPKPYPMNELLAIVRKRLDEA